MATGYLMSEDDAAVIRQAINILNSRSVNVRSSHSVEFPENQPTDLYVAHVEVAGIPPMTEASGTGTGSLALHGDVPGSGKCDVYRRLPGRMVPVGLNLTVYNYSPNAISGLQWIPVAKEKFGDWIALAQVGASGGGTSTFSGAQYYINANQAIPDATPSRVKYDANYFDTDTYYDGTGQFVAPVDGYYLFGGTVTFATGANAAALLGLSAELTSGSFNASYDSQLPGTSFGPTDTPPLTTSGLFKLLAGETVDLSVFQNSGASLDLVQAFAWVTKVGNV